MSDFNIDITTGKPFTRDLSGLIRCYTLGLPFLKNTLLSNLVFSGIFFGLFAWMERKIPALCRTLNITKGPAAWPALSFIHQTAYHDRFFFPSRRHPDDLRHGPPAPAAGHHLRMPACCAGGKTTRGAVCAGRTIPQQRGIDRIFSASKAQGKSLYYVDEPLLESISPDIIFTQDVCEVCQIDTHCTQQAVRKLTQASRNSWRLSPNNLTDVS